MKDNMPFDLYITRDISEKRGVSRFSVNPERMCKDGNDTSLPYGKI
jgi:hypothetical protein